MKDKIKECESVLLETLSGVAWILQQLDIILTKFLVNETST